MFFPGKGLQRSEFWETGGQGMHNWICVCVCDMCVYDVCMMCV